MMKNHPVKDRLLRMSRTIDSRHGEKKASRNGPTSRIGPRLAGKTKESTFLKVKKTSTDVGALKQKSHAWRHGSSADRKRGF